MCLSLAVRDNPSPTTRQRQEATLVFSITSRKPTATDLSAYQADSSNPTQLNPTQSNPSQPNRMQPNQTELTPTQPNPTPTHTTLPNRIRTIPTHPNPNELNPAQPNTTQRKKPKGWTKSR